MIITKTIQQYNEDYVYFCDPIKNNIMNEGHFIRIIYSTPLFVLNGIYISIQIEQLLVEKYYNKFKCSFDVNRYKDLISELRNIEDRLLKKAEINGKQPQHKIFDQLKNGHIKVFSDTTVNTAFVLKISGIWETNGEYGLTYKFTAV
jgi:hypothetical protein